MYPKSVRKPLCFPLVRAILFLSVRERERERERERVIEHRDRER